MRTHAESRAMIRVFRICRKCGAKIFSDAPKGLCTACVLETALGISPDAPVAGVDSSAEVSAKTDDPGRVDELSRDNAKPTSGVKEAVRAATMLGELGDYELLEEIGRGGQGVVFRARQKSLNRTVALKVISLGQWASKAHLKRFRLEAEAAARLEHPGIVPIHEVGERDGSCYFSMKFVEGGQLDEVAMGEPIPIRRAVELIAKVARTVHYAHEHGILHRDIKPGNILLDAKGEPLLTDFGLVRLVEAESTITRTREALGTPSYMAPEQAAGEQRKLSNATDVYGLGAVLYQLLTDHPPFAGGTTYETIKLLLDTEPRQPRLLNPKIDRDLSTICLKCLEKDPQRRYPSALALAEVDGLRVLGRTSSFSFKGKSTDASEVGKKLNVENVLEGSLQREGNRIRVTAELINARNGFHVWSETYEREVQGVFALQDEITRAIVEALKIKLAVSPPVHEQRNTEVYDLYLQGLFFSNKSSEADLRRALRFFQGALEKDPTFSRAWTGIAKVWYFLADVYVKPLEAYPASKEAALKAIALDEKDAEAHCYLSEAKRVLDWDLEGADAELKRSLHQSPGCDASPE